VDNIFYGIQNGQHVEVTWVYLGRLAKWESLLSLEMKELVIPKDDPDNLGIFPSTFKSIFNNFLNRRK
jgi:hypothetical protein